MSSSCLSCGACCAHFRASFHWLETSLAPGGVTPAELTATVTRHRVAMLGTDHKTPRCIALEGRIGEAAQRIARGDGNRAVAHASQGHCLQQNLVCVLEGE